MKGKHILIFQGLFYFITAIWPVYTVASLLPTSSIVYLYSGFNSVLKNATPPVETIILSVGNALALIGIDLIFFFKIRFEKSICWMQALRC